MGKHTFEKHIDTIDRIMRDCAAKLTALDAGIEATRKDIDERKRFGTVSPAQLAVLKEELEAAEVKYREDTAAGIAQARKDVETARSALEAEVKEFSVLHPEDVDNAATALLGAGIATAADLVSLANQFGDNVTMLRLLCSNAERLMDKDPVARALVAQIRTFLDPDSRLDLFDAAVMNAHIGADPALFNIARGAWTEHAFPKFRADMAALDTFSFKEG